MFRGLQTMHGSMHMFCSCLHRELPGGSSHPLAGTQGPEQLHGSLKELDPPPGVCQAAQSHPLAGTQGPEQLHGSLKELDPPPEHPLLAAARARHLQLCSSVRLVDELLRFAKRAAAMPAAMRSHAVAALSQACPAHAQHTCTAVVTAYQISSMDIWHTTSCWASSSEPQAPLPARAVYFGSCQSLSSLKRS